MSSTFRFQTSPALPHLARTSVLRKRRRRPDGEIFLVAADRACITDAHGTRAIESYQAPSSRRAVVMTRRESDLIALANPGSTPPEPLESVYPWLPAQAWLDDSRKGYERLNAVLRRCQPHLISAADFCDEKWNTICNSIGIKSNLDAYFYSAWHLPIQDVFILEERRPNRSVIAIDFNAMYSACMQHPYPKPSALRFVELNRTLSDNDELPLGLYRCLLSEPCTNFIRKHNPFRSFCSGRYLRASIDEPLEIDLNEFEVSFYRRHFRKVRLVHAVVADDLCRHPLAREAKRSYARRANFRSQGNTVLANREKYLSTLLSSCASRPLISKTLFKNRGDALEHLRRDYGICPIDDEPETSVDSWLQGRNRISLREAGSGIVAKAPDISGADTCFLLGQRTVAMGRVVLLEMMEAISSNFPESIICYCNIDSIHFSIPNTELEKMLNWLRTRASDQMGSFKIEAVTKCGLWLEPGRYWLHSDEVVKFRNRGIASAGRPFRDHAVHVATRKIGDLTIPIRASIRMDRSMSATRNLVGGSDGIIYQNLIEVADNTTFESVLDAIEHNRAHAVSIRTAAFSALRDEIEHHCPATSGQ